MKTPVVIVLLVLSVTAFLHIPPASAEDVTITVSPTKVYTGQTFTLVVDTHNDSPHDAEFTYYYGGSEVSNWNVRFNRTYYTRMDLPDITCHGGLRCFGAYSVRVWFDNETYWSPTIEYVSSYFEEHDDREENTNQIVSAFDGMGRLFVSAAYLMVFVFFLWSLVMVLWAQHRAARKKGKLSFYDKMRYKARRIVGHTWGGFRQPRPQEWKMWNARANLVGMIIKATEGNPAFWDIDQAKRDFAIFGTQWLEAIDDDQRRSVPRAMKLDTRKWKRKPYPERMP